VEEEGEEEEEEAEEEDGIKMKRATEPLIRIWDGR